MHVQIFSSEVLHEHKTYATPLPPLQFFLILFIAFGAVLHIFFSAEAAQKTRRREAGKTGTDPRHALPHSICCARCGPPARPISRRILVVSIYSAGQQQINTKLARTHARLPKRLDERRAGARRRCGAGDENGQTTDVMEKKGCPRSKINRRKHRVAGAVCKRRKSLVIQSCTRYLKKK